MFTKRQFGAALFMSALWAGVHAAFSAVWGIWSFLQWDSHPWSALPGWLLLISGIGARAGAMAGFVFALLVHRFEWPSTVASLSMRRAAAWGILASVPAYSIAEGMLWAIRSGAPLHSIVEPIPYYATVGGLAAVTMMALARRGSDDFHRPVRDERPETPLLARGSWWERIRPRRTRIQADPRAAVLSPGQGALSLLPCPSTPALQMSGRPR